MEREQKYILGPGKMHYVYRVHCASLRPWLEIPSSHIRGEHGSVHLYGAGGEGGEDRWILWAQ